MGSAWIQKILRHATLEQGKLVVAKPTHEHRWDVALVQLLFRNSEQCLAVTEAWDGAACMFGLQEAGEIYIDEDSGLVEFRRRSRSSEWLKEPEDPEAETEATVEKRFVEYFRIDDIFKVQAGCLSIVDEESLRT